MRTIGMKEIEDIALGAALLGAGGGKQQYLCLRRHFFPVGSMQENIAYALRKRSAPGFARYNATSTDRLKVFRQAFNVRTFSAPFAAFKCYKYASRHN